MCVQLMGEVTTESVRASQTSFVPPPPRVWGRTGAQNQTAGSFPSPVLLGNCRAPVNKPGEPTAAIRISSLHFCLLSLPIKPSVWNQLGSTLLSMISFILWPHDNLWVSGSDNFCRAGVAQESHFSFTGKWSFQPSQLQREAWVTGHRIHSLKYCMSDHLHQITLKQNQHRLQRAGLSPSRGIAGLESRSCCEAF